MTPDPRSAITRRVFWVLAVASIATLVWMGRGLTFFSDEWAFITSRSLADPATWWAPHNEHWSTVPVLAYRALVETVGLRTYVPYLLVIAVLHGLVAWLVYRAVERRAAPMAALGAASIVLFFGAGFENLYWGFQVGFVGSMVAGLVALDALDGAPSGWRAAVVAGALLVAEMASGMGILFAGAAALLMVASTAWRRWLWVLVIPGSAYVAWFVLIGRSGVGVFRDPLAASSIAAVPGFMADGFKAALGAATGLDPLGPVLVVLAVGLAGLGAARGWRPTPRVVALLLAIAAQYALIAVTRAGVTATQVAYPRYTYVSGILMVEILTLSAGPALERLRAAAALSPARWRRVAGFATAPVILTLALVWNLQLLIAGREVFLERAALTRALIAESLRPDPPSGADLARDLILVPSPLVLRQLVAEHGTPLEDAILPWAVEPIPESLLAEARRRLVEGPPIPVPEDVE
jgi:hypothetical protein